MIGFTPLVLAVGIYYGATPREATEHVLYTRSGAPLVIDRVNVVGRYATVLTKNGMMESGLVGGPILFEQFSFGWQALESLNLQCRIDRHGLSTGTKASLMRGMPKPSAYSGCGKNDGPDLGPPEEVEALRRDLSGPLVPSARIVGNFAFGNWYGAGGGERLYRSSHGTWRAVLGGGGAIDASEAMGAGVPRASLCALGIYDAVCTHAR
jgi:hypothetical protein